jgi:hypothetical protein
VSCCCEKLVRRMEDSSKTSVSLFSLVVSRIFQTVKRRTQARRHSQLPMHYKTKTNHKNGKFFDTER